MLGLLRVETIPRSYVEIIVDLRPEIMPTARKETVKLYKMYTVVQIYNTWFEKTVATCTMYLSMEYTWLKK